MISILFILFLDFQTRACPSELLPTKEHRIIFLKSVKNWLKCDLT